MSAITSGAVPARPEDEEPPIGRGGFFLMLAFMVLIAGFWAVLGSMVLQR